MNYQNFASIEPQLQPHFAGTNPNPAGFREYPGHFSSSSRTKLTGDHGTPYTRHDEGRGIPQITENNMTITDKLNV